MGRLSSWRPSPTRRVDVLTLMKPYARARMSDVGRALAAVGLPADALVLERYERPHGPRLGEGGILSWGKADDWKLIVRAAHERAFARCERIRGMILLPPLSRYRATLARAAIVDACRKLGVEQLAWHDPYDQLDAQPERLALKLARVGN